MVKFLNDFGQKDARFQPIGPQAVAMGSEVPEQAFAPSEVDYSGGLSVVQAGINAYNRYQEKQQEEQVKEDKKLLNTMKNDYVLSLDNLQTQYDQKQISSEEFAIKQRQLRDEYIKNTGNYLGADALMGLENGVTGVNVTGKLVANKIAREEDALKYSIQKQRDAVEAFTKLEGAEYTQLLPYEAQLKEYNNAMRIATATQIAAQNQAMLKKTSTDPNIRDNPEFESDEMATAGMDMASMVIGQENKNAILNGTGYPTGAQMLQMKQDLADLLVSKGHARSWSNAAAAVAMELGGYSGRAKMTDKWNEALTNEAKNRAERSDALLKIADNAEVANRKLWNYRIALSPEQTGVMVAASQLLGKDMTETLATMDPDFFVALQGSKISIEGSSNGATRNTGTGAGMVANRTVNNALLSGIVGYQNSARAFANAYANFLNYTMAGNGTSFMATQAYAGNHNNMVQLTQEDVNNPMTSATATKMNNTDNLIMAYERLDNDNQFESFEEKKYNFTNYYLPDILKLATTNLNSVMQTGFAENIRYDEKNNKFVLAANEGEDIGTWDKISSLPIYASLNKINALLMKPKLLWSEPNGASVDFRKILAAKLIENNQIPFLGKEDRTINQGDIGAGILKIGNAIQGAFEGTRPVTEAVKEVGSGAVQTAKGVGETFAKGIEKITEGAVETLVPNEGETFDQWKNRLSQKVYEAWAETASDISGQNITPEAVREYVHGVADRLMSAGKIAWNAFTRSPDDSSFKPAAEMFLEAVEEGEKAGEEAVQAEEENLNADDIIGAGVPFEEAEQAIREQLPPESDLTPEERKLLWRNTIEKSKQDFESDIQKRSQRFIDSRNPNRVTLKALQPKLSEEELRKAIRDARRVEDLSDDAALDLIKRVENMDNSLTLSELRAAKNWYSKQSLFKKLVTAVRTFTPSRMIEKSFLEKIKDLEKNILR